MSRADYCRDQARFCRELALQISNPPDAQQLREEARQYDDEAKALERPATPVRWATTR